MKLSGDANHRDPTPADIRAAFAQFSPHGEFLILDKSADEFMQAAPGRIEHRDASGHYVAEAEYSDELASRLFVSYLEGDAWRTMVPWREMTAELQRDGAAAVQHDQSDPPSRRRRGALSLVAVLVGLAMVWMIWLTLRTKGAP